MRKVNMRVRVKTMRMKNEDEGKDEEKRGRGVMRAKTTRTDDEGEVVEQ